MSKKDIANFTHIGIDVPMEIARPLILYKLMKLVKITASGCWNFQGYLHPSGYGMISFRQKNWRAHRLMLVLTKGEIPADWDACHTCDNRRCINPGHLFGGTRADNVQDMRVKKRGNHQKQTDCKWGHPFDEANTYVDPRGFRACRTCNRIRLQTPRYKAKAAARQQKNRAARSALNGEAKP